MSARVVYLADDLGHNHSVTVFGVTGRSDALPTTNNNPISTVDSLYTRGAVREISDLSSTRLLQMEVWVAANCIRDVYVDLNHHRVAFLDGQFIADQFFSTPTSDLPPVMRVGVSGSTATEISAWVMEHKHTGIRMEAHSIGVITVCIPDEVLAVMFKLKWSEDIIA